MTISVFLRDAFTKRAAKITNDGEVLVTSSVFPPLGKQKSKIFRQYLTQDGTASGDSDMGVDGSTVNVDYYIEADQFNDRYISNISLIVGYGTTSQPFKFADATALTNGIRFYYDSADQGEIDIHDGLKSNQDFFRISHSSVDANWEVRGVDATNDYGYFIIIDLESFMPPFGVKLDAATRQKIVMTIRDDVTAADSLNCIAYGFDRFK